MAAADGMVRGPEEGVTTSDDSDHKNRALGVDVEMQRRISGTANVGGSMSFASVFAHLRLAPYPRPFSEHSPAQTAWEETTFE